MNERTNENAQMIEWTNEFDFKQMQSSTCDT